MKLLAGLGCLLLLLLGPGAPAQPESGPRPHIVLFLADDLGWADVGYHGGAIPTPHIDALAKAGVRLEQFYVQPACTPTRASLMTGRYPMRMGLQVGTIRPWDRYGLPLEERTLAEALREAGYVTAITGKWHLGHWEQAYLPRQRGFDRQYGGYGETVNYFTHRLFGGLDWHRDGKPLVEEGYATDLVAQEASRIIAGHDSKRPLFLYVPFNAPHPPLQAPEEYLARHEQIEGLDRRLYAAMVSCMDAAIGRVVAALDKRGMRSETLILFASDNGGATWRGADNGALRGGKGSLFEGGIRVPALAVWPGRLKAGAVSDEVLHVVDLYPTLLRLAGASLDQPLPLDGHDVWPTLAQGKAQARTHILHDVTPGRGALRSGDWKLVVTGAGAKQTATKTSLFHIGSDPHETRDLSSENPEKVEELLALLAGYRKQAVTPEETPGRKPEGFKAPEVWGAE